MHFRVVSGAGPCFLSGRRSRAALGYGTTVDTFGRHLLVEYHGCDPACLDDLDRVRQLLYDAASAARVRVVAEAFHRYRPQGVTGVVVIEESHLAVHTWPETGYAAVDFYTCGDGWPEAAREVIGAGFRASRADSLMVHRGTPRRPSLEIGSERPSTPDAGARPLEQKL